jgi:hypothetical protein
MVETPSLLASFQPVLYDFGRLSERLRDLSHGLARGVKFLGVLHLGSVTVELTEVVTAVEKKDGAQFVSVGRENGGKVGPDVSHMRVTDRGLFRATKNGTAFETQYCVLQLPFKPGSTWTPGPGGQTKLKYTAAKEEDMEVPAGKFRAFRVEVEIETAGRTRRSTVWYAAGVGVVKQEYKDADSAYVKVLKSFTPAK